MKPWPLPSRIILAPSLLAADHGNLREALGLVHTSGAEWLHLDIMDGHFVPNLSFGPQVVADLRPHSGLFFDVHLMLDNPDAFITPFSKAGADLITVHIEPPIDTAQCLEQIRAQGCRTGLALNPGTSCTRCLGFLGMVDLILLMTVQPGFGGQSFRQEVLEKISYLDAVRQSEGHSFRIEVDGGIDLTTGSECRAAGADTLVAGTAFFRSDQPSSFLRQIES